jgi:hypothetical protein
MTAKGQEVNAYTRLHMADANARASTSGRRELDAEFVWRQREDCDDLRAKNPMVAICVERQLCVIA